MEMSKRMKTGLSVIVAAAVTVLSGCDQKSTIPILGGDSLAVRLAVVMELAQAGQAIAPENVTGRSGDRIKLQVTPAEGGYGYVFHQGSGGDYSMLFPVSAAGSAPPQVVAKQALNIPAGAADWLTFDDKPGVEKLVVVFSRHKVMRIENLLLENPVTPEAIDKAIRELRSSLPAKYELEKAVESNGTTFKLTTKDPSAYILAETELRHQ